MSKFRNLIENILIESILFESEAKINFLLQNKKLEDAIILAIQNDPEIENKKISPKDLLIKWDEDPIISKNMQWVVKQYTQKLFHAGDLYRIKDDLQKFEKYKRNKNLFDNPDINKYNYSDLKDKLSQFNNENISQLGSSARKSAIEKGKDEAEKVYEDNRWVIIVPETEAASRYWGKGTHWCTAADSENNMFTYYNKQGPLYILINKNDPLDKYQFHFESGQFMNRNDNEINIEEFIKDNPNVENYFKKIIDKTNYRNWIFYNAEDLDYNTYLEVVKQDGWALAFVPKELITPEMCLEAVKQNEWTLEHVPEELITPEMCMIAIKQNGYALKYVPKELRTYEMCMIAVKQNGNALEFVPEELITPEMCMTAIKEKAETLRDVPEELRTYELCLEAVKQDGWALQYVPKELITPEMCMTAVKHNGDALKFVPKQLKTLEMCLEAVKQGGYNLEYVPEKLKTPEFCLAAVKQNGDALKFVPKQLKTLEMCLEAVKQDGWALQYVPEQLRTYELCLAAVKQNRYGLQFVPERYRDQIKQELGL